MGKSRNAEPPAPDWRHATLSVAVLVATVGTLGLGAMLEAGPDRGEKGDIPNFSASARSVPSVSPAAAPAGDDEPALGFSGDADLVDRAVADERRLRASGPGYTLQFGVMCDPQNVRTTLGTLDAEPSFYLLTMLYRDRACFRVCWGFYDTESQAAAERAIPAALRSMTATPKVISVADALP